MSTPPPFKRVDVEDLKVGTTITSTYAVLEASVGEASNGSPYVSLQIGDRTGEVPAKQWDTDELPVEQGQIAKVRATVEEYRGDPQLRIERVRHYHECDDLTPFLRASHVPRHELHDSLSEWVSSLRSEVSDLVHAVVELAGWDAFLAAPGSQRYHHAYLRGLAEHTLSMLELALRICDHYAGRTRDSVYAMDVDIDLVLAGVILHDLGKAADAERVGVSWEKTDQARHVGHIGTCLQWIAVAGERTGADPDLVERLSHLVCSHHGRPYHGSPVRPATVEALILHHVDTLDADVAMMREATEGLEPGEWSEYRRPLGCEVTRWGRDE